MSNQNLNETLDMRTTDLSNRSLRTTDPPSEVYYNLCEEREIRIREPQDWRDISRHPSYTNVKAPFHTVYQERIKKKAKEFEAQFQLEIAQQIAYQANAYEAVRLERHMCITTLWPPLHSRKEIERTQKYFFHNVSKKDRKRIEYLLKNDIF